MNSNMINKMIFQAMLLAYSKDGDTSDVEVPIEIVEKIDVIMELVEIIFNEKA